MTEQPWLRFFYDLPWAVWARDTPGVFFAAETLHFVGLSLLLGALLLADLRLIGLWRRLKPALALSFVHLAGVGFAINAVTGIMMFCADPYNYWTNWVFQVKLILILLAGLNLAVLQFGLHRRIMALPEGAATTLPMKIAGALSLTLWILVIVAGRMLPSFEGAGGLFSEPPQYYEQL